MKGLITIVASILIMHTSAIFADSTPTDLTAGWTCKTNASSTEVPMEKAADKEMSTMPKAIADSFGMAAKNCRNCTKITCKKD